MDRKEKLSNLYRGKKSYKFEEKDQEFLEFQTLAWEKEDREIDEDSSDDNEYDYESFEEGYEQKKKYKDKHLVLRTYGLTQKGVSVCLEITGFQPYFLLKLPPTWGKSKVKMLEQRILSKVGYRKKEISFSVIKMKKLYFFDNYKNHLFLKISFKTEGARYDTMKKLIPNEAEPISAKVIKIQKTFEFNVGGSKIKFDVYETRMDTIIRFIHVSGILPAGIIKIEFNKLKRTITRSTCQIVKTIDWKQIQIVDDDWVAPFRTSSFDIECTSKDGSFPQAKRIEDKIIQIGTTTRVHGEKHCRIRHIVTLKDSNDIPDINILVHPECPYETVKEADYAGSTSYIINVIDQAPSGSKWAIGTEMNLVQRLIEQYPDKEIVSLNPNLCPCMTMNRIDLPHLLWSLDSIKTKEYKNIIKVDKKTTEESIKALNQMLKNV